MLLVRLILISLIIYLIVRSFARYFEEKEEALREKERKFQGQNNPKKKTISKELGEFVDYEEVDD